MAIEQTYRFEGLSTKTGSDPIPEPVDLKEISDKINGKLKLFNRLTIVYSDPAVSHACSKSPAVKKYHIFAALPITDSAFQHSCQTLQCDIITYNLNTTRIRFSRKFYYLAIRRNLFFEIKYTPAILDANDRRATIIKAQQYHMVGKSKGIILSSGARDKFHVRSPYDVACLGYIFGLTEELGRAAVSSMCKKLLVAAESRRLGRTPLVVRYEDINSSTEEEEEDSEEEKEVMEVDSDSNKKRRNENLLNLKNKKIKIS